MRPLDPGPGRRWDGPLFGGEPEPHPAPRRPSPRSAAAITAAAALEPAEPAIHLIDAHYQIFRAYHALPDMRVADPAYPESGRPVGAVRGYASALIRYLREQRPTHVAAAWDSGRASFRRELYPGYKQGRSETPADLEPQFAPCAALTRALGIPLFTQPRFEADDVIATLVRRLEPCGLPIWIWTKDKDLGALVGERVGLIDPGDDQRLGPAQIQERLGVPPAQVPDYLSLVGDASDSIPGVPGIGPRAARALLERFGAIDAIPADFAAWPADLGLRGARGICEKLRAHGAELELSRALVRMRDDLPLEVSLDALAYRGAPRAELEPALREHGALGLLARVPRFQ